MKILNLLCFLPLFLSLFDKIICWDNTEMQMFDLVEEVNENFYDYLGVGQNATNLEIRRAYRKLSLRYHPDRNPNSEDALKFRHLVAIYEVLKDDNIRVKYNEVLKFGLPDWKMPSYYFRKLRKMSFIESCLLFTILATFIHYACLWGVYFEQKLNMEDFLSRRKRKRNNESEISQQLKTDFKPQWKNILPIIIVKFIYNFTISTPNNLKLVYKLVKKEILAVIDKQTEKKLNERKREDEKKMIEEKKKEKKERKLALTKEINEKRKAYETGIQNAMAFPVEVFSDIPTANYPVKEGIDELALGPWADKDTVALIKSLSKFPAGVNNRWIKICDFVKRPLHEVTMKVKEIQASSKEGKVPINNKMQNSLGDGVEEQFEMAQSLVAATNLQIKNNLLSESETDDIKSSAVKKIERKKLSNKSHSVSVPNEKQEETRGFDVDNQNGNSEESIISVRKKTRSNVRVNDNSELVDTNFWTQIEQKKLEEALRTFPKGTADRWDKISQMIPTKSKVECIERIKKLSQSIQEKQNRNNL